MTVKRLFLSGRFYDDSALADLSTLQEANHAFFEGALLCHNLKQTEKNGKMQWLGDPMEVALVQMAKRVVPGGVDAPRLDEVPFDAERKRMSTLHQTPRGPMLYSKGALEKLLPLCHQIQTGTQIQPLTSELKEQVLRAQEEMAERGLRVLALAWRAVAAAYDRDRL